MNDILPNEIITRFIFDSGNQYFSSTNKIVRFKSFMPPRDREDRSKYSPDLSVCRISVPSGNGVLPKDKIWKIGLKIGLDRQPSKKTKSPSESFGKQCFMTSTLKLSQTRNLVIKNMPTSVRSLQTGWGVRC